MRSAGRLLLVLALAVALLAPTGCSGPAMPSEEPGIRGRITTLSRAGDAITILVEGGPQQPGAVSDKALVRVPPEATVFDSQGGVASREALKQGIEVDVWFTGPVAESYPVQGTAKAVRVTGQ